MMCNTCISVFLVSLYIVDPTGVSTIVIAGASVGGGIAVLIIVAVLLLLLCCLCKKKPSCNVIFNERDH